MTWTAPAAARIKPPYLADERTRLDASLDYHRATLLGKCAGLTGEQLARRPVPSSALSLLGLVRHMAANERVWFRIRFAREAIDDLYQSPDHPEGGEFALADPAAAEADSLSTTKRSPDPGLPSAAGPWTRPLAMRPSRWICAGCTLT